MLLWLFYITAEVLIQWYLITKKSWRPDYLKLFVIRGMFSILHGVALDVEPGWQYPILVVWQCCTFWILFDLGLNLARGKEIFYRGATSGWIDRLLPEDLYIPLKAVALVCAGIAYYLGFQIWGY